MLGFQTTAGIKVKASALILKNPITCECSVLNLSKYFFHFFLGLVSNNTLADAVVAVFGCIGNGITHASKAALIDQINDQLHLVHALIVSIFRIITGLTENFKSDLHKFGDASAQHSLLSEKISLRLFAERCLEKSCTAAADPVTIGKSNIAAVAGVVLIYSIKTGNTAADLILRAYSMSRAFWCNHKNINVGRGDNSLKMDIESVGESKRFSFTQIRENVLFIHVCLFLIIYENHNDISCFCSISSGHNGKTGFLCRLSGF